MHPSLRPSTHPSKASEPPRKPHKPTRSNTVSHKLSGSNFPKPTSRFKVVQSSVSANSPYRLTRSGSKKEDDNWTESVQKANEQRAIDSLNIIKWVTVLSEAKVDRHTLKDAALHLKPADYREDVIIERHSSGLCGYPLCDNAPRRPFTSSASPQLQICLSRRKVLDVKQSSQFCSTICYKHSEWYEKSVLGREPMWAQPSSQRMSQTGADQPIGRSPEVQLLEEIEEQKATVNTTPSHPSSSNSMNEMMTPLIESSGKEDLDQILASLTITEHTPFSSDSDFPRPLPPSPRQSIMYQAECSDRGGSLKTTQAQKVPRTVRWADGGGFSDDDEPMLDADTFESFGEMIKQQSMLNASTAGSFHRRAQTRSQVHMDELGGNMNVVGCGWESEVVYNVGSVEDRMAIDFAMKLRDELMVAEEAPDVNP